MSKQVALITGSTRGIGLSAALALAQEGFSIALNGLPGDADMASAQAQIADTGADVISAAFDVADVSAHSDALEKIEVSLGPLTTLVNNAGVGVMERGDPLNVSEESWDRCLAVNAKAHFFLIQAFANVLIGRKRDSSLHYSVVSVTSSNAVAVAEPRSEYCASKAAAAMVAKTWAVRLGRENIAVYDVQPGIIETDMTAPVMDQYNQRIADGLTLLPRAGQPEDMGAIIASLASGKLPYTTGQAISADGGMLLQRF